MSQDRILVVEDDGLLLRVFRRWFLRKTTGQAVRLDIVTSAQEGLDLVRATPEDRWFVLTDNKAEMRDRAEIQTGLELIARIRKLQPRVNAFMILMSGDATREAAAEAGADEFLGKPFAMSAVAELLDPWMRP